MTGMDLLRNELKKYKENEIFFASNLYKEKLYGLMTEAAFYKGLERLCEKGELMKLSKGIYNLPKKSRLGLVPVLSKDIVNFFTKNNRGTVVGYHLYRNLNISTQVPKKITLVSSEIESDIKTIKEIEIKKVMLDFNEETIQLIHLLDGTMSLVGPRPYLPREIEDMGEYYDDIIKTKPGLTGYWQVNGRSEISLE